MRDSNDHRWAFHDAPEGAVSEQSDPSAYWRSFFASSVEGEASDRHTMGAITDVESRFHYNATENSILRAWATLFPPARGGLIRVARLQLQKLDRRSMDVGSGAGHWVDFARDALLIRKNLAIEITEQMCDHLRTKYAGQEGFAVLQADVTRALPEELTGAFDVITAIGVMFHIVDDNAWQAAMANLSQCLKPDGLLILGGDFGIVDRDSQFHNTDDFKTWREESRARREDRVLVNKRVRSLATWTRAAHTLGLEVVALERTERHPSISTPENDILILRRA